jgi:hypothetical protein
MKRVLSVSLGDPARDKVTEVVLAGQRIRLERRGTGGDRRRALALLRKHDGQVDAFGLGGIDLGLEVDGRLYPLQAGQALARVVRQTPIVDGTGLKRTLERRAAAYVEQTLGPITPKRVLLSSGADRWGLALGFADAGYELVLGDLMFAFGLPWPLRSLAAGRRLARLALPLVSRMPFEWFYPTGARQTEWRPRFARWFAWASVFAGDRHYLMRHRPARLEGKIVVTNTTTPTDVETLKTAGARAVVTTTPVLDGRSFGTNVLEAALVAVAGHGRPLQTDELEGWVDKAGLSLSLAG